jgi:hypothetical protein
MNLEDEEIAAVNLCAASKELAGLTDVKLLTTSLHALCKNIISFCFSP